MQYQTGRHENQFAISAFIAAFQILSESVNLLSNCLINCSKAHAKYSISLAVRKWVPVRSYFEVFRSETKRPADFGHLWTFVNQTGCYTVHFKSNLVKSKSTRIKVLSAKS